MIRQKHSAASIQVRLTETSPGIAERNKDQQIRNKGQKGNTASLIPYYHAIVRSAPSYLRWVQTIRSPVDYRRDLHLLNRICDRSNRSSKSDIRGHGFHLEGRKVIAFDDGLRAGAFFAISRALDAGWTVLLFVCPAFFDNTDLMYRHKASILVEAAYAQVTVPTVLARVSNMLTERGIAGDGVGRQLLNVTYADRDVLDVAAKILGIDIRVCAQHLRPYLGSEALHALSRRGVLIGSHGMDHAPVSGSDTHVVVDMVNESLDRIARIVPLHARLFSYPFGDAGITQRRIDELIERCTLDYSFGTAGWRPEWNARHVQRLRMETEYGACGILLREVMRKLLRKILGRSVPRRSGRQSDEESCAVRF